MTVPISPANPPGYPSGSGVNPAAGGSGTQVTATMAGHESEHSTQPIPTVVTSTDEVLAPSPVAGGPARSASAALPAAPPVGPAASAQRRPTRAEEEAGDPGARGFRYIPGLDGIRAIAVLAVIIYHSGTSWMGESWLPGGFLGVDVFFVLSGFLITSLLLSEREKTGRVDFKQFYLRRARRLLPALFTMLALTAVLALTVARDAAAQMYHDAIAAIFYVTNWAYIFSDTSYFEAIGRPPLLQHLWSLAVEEQFYLIWPVVAMLLYRWKKRDGVWRGALYGALGSTALMVILAFVWNMPTNDASRIYFGTDTHLMGLMLGAALAAVYRPGRVRRALPFLARMLIWGVGIASLLALIWFLFNTHEDSQWLYRGGFFVISGVVALLIAAASHPAVAFGKVLATQPMRYIGERSYGLYLYHWPIFLVTRPTIDLPFPDPWATVLRFGLLFAVAELSFRFIEMPIRRGAIGAAVRRWREQGMATVVIRSTGVLVAFVGSVFLLGTALAAVPVVDANTYLGGKTAEGAGDLAAEKAQAAAAASASPSATALPSGDPSSAASPGAAVTPENPNGYATNAAGVPLVKLPTTAIGDSVLLGASGAITKKIPQAKIDAEVSRHTYGVLDRVKARKAAGVLGDVVIIHTGTNGPAYYDELKMILDPLKDRERVVLVNTRVPRSWEDESNSNIEKIAKKYPNVRIADWYAISNDRRDYFVSDGVHTSEAGAKAFAKLIRDTIRQP